MNITVFRYAGIGDSFLVFPILQELRKRYPDAHITFVCNKGAIDMAYYWKLADRCIAREFLPINLVNGHSIESQEWLDTLRWSDTCYFMEYCSSPEMFENVTRLCDDVHFMALPYEKTLARHNLLKHRDVVGLDTVEWEPPKYIVEKGSPVIISPGSADIDRTWSLKNFINLCDFLLEIGIPVIWLEEHKSLDTHGWKDDYGHFLHLHDIELSEVSEYLRRCSVYVGNDSAVAHLAGLCGVNTIPLFKRVYLAQTHPVGPRVYPIADEKVNMISVERVLDKVQKLWYTV